MFDCIWELIYGGKWVTTWESQCHWKKFIYSEFPREEVFYAPQDHVREFQVWSGGRKCEWTAWPRSFIVLPRQRQGGEGKHFRMSWSEYFGGCVSMISGYLILILGVIRVGGYWLGVWELDGDGDGLWDLDGGLPVKGML